MSPSPAPRSLTLLGSLILAIVALTLVGTEVLGGRKFLIFGVVATSLVTFFGFLSMGMAERPTSYIPDQLMRSAITASVVVTFLVMVGFGTFFVEQAGGMPPIAQALLTSFSSIVGVVVAFYFGSSAFIDAKKADHATPASTDAA